MGNIRFASNNVAHFPGASAGSVVGTFDATRVPYAITLSNYEVVSSPVFAPVAGDVTWFHFRCHATAGSLSAPTGATGIFFQAFDAMNRLIYDIKKLESNRSLFPRHTLYNGTTSIAATGSLPLTTASISTIDIKLTVQPLEIRAELYVNTGLVATSFFASNPNGLTAPVRFTLGCAFGEITSSVHHFSEILVSDMDTRHARVNFLRPRASGAFSDWSGSIVALADDDLTTGLTSLIAGNRFTCPLTPYEGAANVSNVVLQTMSIRGQNSPTKLKHTLRLSGINYDSADIPIGFSTQLNVTDYPVNPGTSLPWVSSDFSSLESGFLSVA